MDKVITFRIDKELLKELKNYAKTLRLKKSEAIRYILAQHFGLKDKHI